MKSKLQITLDEFFLCLVRKQDQIEPEIEAKSGFLVY